MLPTPGIWPGTPISQCFDHSTISAAGFVPIEIKRVGTIGYRKTVNADQLAASETDTILTPQTDKNVEAE